MPESPLHRAIYDALKDPRYGDRGILVSTILDATHRLDADESLLYRAVYTIFRALPGRLLPGSTLVITTMDLPGGGVELVWEGRERIEPTLGEPTDVRALLVTGPHGDLVEIAMLALERFCHMRAGHLESRRESVEDASSFPRPPHVIRRVVANIPGRPVVSSVTGSATTPVSRAANGVPPAT